MSELVPSYILKADRAEKHLHDLKVTIGQWAETHPYEVRRGFKGKRDARYLRFTSSPPLELGTMAADFIYNLRSGLDHLMADLVPSAQRCSVYFPIYFQGVWEDPVTGENERCTKQRGRWRSDTANLRPEAAAILKSLQPPEGARQRDEGVHALLLLNRISNTDRHQRLPVLFTALKGFRLLWQDPQGNQHIAPTATGIPADDLRVLQNGAELGFPPGSRNVQVAGAPVVAVRIPDPPRDIEIPGAFDQALHAYRMRVVGPLSPYVHRPGGGNRNASPRL